MRGELRRIGFIGLGVMGGPMARNLLGAGYDLVVCDRDPAARAALQDAGAIEAPTPAAVAEASELVVTMLPDAPDVEAVIFGVDGIIEGLRPGLIVIDMSSISPVATKRFAEELNHRDAYAVHDLLRHRRRRVRAGRRGAGMPA